MQWFGPTAMFLALICIACGPAVPERRAEVELAIAAQRADGRDLIADIAGVAQDAAGRVWVADRLVAEIVVFGRDGSLLFRMGRPGNGPGEFALPCCLTFDGEGRLWVLDAGNSRYAVFAPGDSGATPLFSVPAPSEAQALRRPITFDATGRVFDVRLGAESGATRYRLDSLGVALDTIVLAPWPPDSLDIRPLGTGGAIFWVWPPFGPEDLIAFGPRGDHARAISRSYAVTWYDADGEVVTVLRDERARSPALTAEQRREADRQIHEEASRVGMLAMELGPLMPFRHQVLAALFFDRAGRLWVERHVRPGEDRRADVYNRDGALAFRATWPADVDLSRYGWIAENAALGVRPDTIQDTERVVRLRWR
ncbi:MAG: hypothetical protein HY701_01390 [Gemmatimonadetes bacterium]|nr:hypothetical protein [Gemmatimonadota bacterium]